MPSRAGRQVLIWQPQVIGVDPPQCLMSLHFFRDRLLGFRAAEQTAKSPLCRAVKFSLRTEAR